MANDPHSIQTAGKKIRHLGSARSGTGAARLMHVTSVALIPLAIAFVFVLASLIHKDYAGVRETLGRPVPALLMILFVGASIPHMKAGMQAIIDDYVHERHAKEFALMANLFFSVILGLACLYALLKVSFVQG